jgi:hypothetical protein
MHLFSYNADVEGRSSAAAGNLHDSECFSVMEFGVGPESNNFLTEKNDTRFLPCNERSVSQASDCNFDASELSYFSARTSHLHLPLIAILLLLELLLL